MLRHLSASTIQVFLNQILGLFIFYLTSTFLSKNSFGEMNWTVATLTTILTILSFGMDQVVVKKIASGYPASTIGGLQLVHTIFSGILFIAILFTGFFLSPAFFSAHPYLTGFGLSILITYLSSSYKQMANGLQKFHLLAVMSVSANIARCLLLLIAAFFYSLSIETVIIVYIISSFVELLVCSYLSSTRINTPLWPSWNFSKYLSLAKESLPQLGVVLFNSVIARFDWILIGLMATSLVTAEYTFAYKLFELMTVPLLILSPIMLPWFTKLIHASSDDAVNKENLGLLFKLEMIAATIIPLIANILWIPVLDHFTNGKYGTSNADVFLILSFCLPFVYINNYYWTISFARGHMKIITGIIIITFSINIAADLLLIGHWGGTGAAVAYIMAIIIQTILYACASRKEPFKPFLIALIKGLVCSQAAYWGAVSLSDNVIIQLSLGIIFYVAAIIVSGLLRQKDFYLLKKSLRGS